MLSVVGGTLAPARKTMACRRSGFRNPLSFTACHVARHRIYDSGSVCRRSLAMDRCRTRCWRRRKSGRSVQQYTYRAHGLLAEIRDVAAPLAVTREPEQPEQAGKQHEQHHRGITTGIRNVARPTPGGITGPGGSAGAWPGPEQWREIDLGASSFRAKEITVLIGLWGALPVGTNGPSSARSGATPPSIERGLSRFL